MSVTGKETGRGGGLHSPKRKPKVVVIAGPTAAGKTAVGLRMAHRFNAHIVSADSVQVYRFLDIGSAKPTPAELRQVPHHMVDIRDPDEYFSVGDYVREGRQCIEHILKKGLIPLVIGGTGLYIRSLLGGVVEAAAADPEARERLRLEEELGGPGTLFTRLERVDPESARRIGPENLSRIVRALEVFELSGRPLSELHREHGFGDRPYRVLFIGVAPDRDLLRRRIDDRVDRMVEQGLVDEARQLIGSGYGLGLRSMQSLGYRHMGLVASGQSSLDDAIELMKRDTRRYAKRQLTWFRSEPGIVWRDPQDVEGIELSISDFLGQ